MKILIAGDFCPQNRVAVLFEKQQFGTILAGVKPIVESADYGIVNFECPIANDAATAIHKQGPNLRCSESGLDAVKWAGFNCVTLANNHFLDYGEVGARATLDTCEKNKIDHVGGGKNLKEASSISANKVG